MKHSLPIPIIIFLTIFLAACADKTKLQPSIPMLTEPAQTQTSSDTLSLDRFQNNDIYGFSSGKTVKLSDGKFESGSGEDYLLVQLLPQAAFGDLNGDGREDAALLISENMGGSGVFVSLNALLATDAGYTQVAPVLVDDRPLIDSVTIEDGDIVLNATIHGVSDSMAEPTEQVSEKYRYINGRLVLMNFISTNNGATRTITIDTPTEGQEASGSVEMKGSMPIAPFENTLVVRIYNEENELLSSEAFMVNAADAGGPATFDNTVTLPEVTAGAKIRMELAELSATDGSLLCSNSVELIVN